MGAVAFGGGGGGGGGGGDLGRRRGGGLLAGGVFGLGVGGAAAESPGVVAGAVAVQVQVPVGVRAGVAGGLPEAGGGAGGHHRGGAAVEVMHARGGGGVDRGVAVVVAHHAGDAFDGAGEPAATGVAAGHRAGGVAGDYRAADDAPGQPADGDYGAGAGVDGGGGIAAQDFAAAGGGADQPADGQRVGVAGDRTALDVAGGDAGAAIGAGQDAGLIKPGAGDHVGVDDAQIADSGGGAEKAEQAVVILFRGVADAQIADGMAVAVKGGVPRIPAVDKGVDVAVGQIIGNHPVEGGAGVGIDIADGAADGPPVGELVIGVDGVVVIGVEIQVGGQFVAAAAALGAAHIFAGGEVAVGEGGGVIGLPAGPGIAVAVQVPPDYIELGQGGDFD